MMATTAPVGLDSKSAEELLDELIEANLDFVGFAQTHEKRVDDITNELGRRLQGVRRGLQDVRTSVGESAYDMDDDVVARALVRGDAIENDDLDTDLDARADALLVRLERIAERLEEKRQERDDG
jgi:hypothetical protein